MSETIATGVDLDFNPVEALPELPPTWRNLGAALLNETAKRRNSPLEKDSDSGEWITAGASAQKAAAIAYFISQKVPADQKNVGVIFLASTIGAQVNRALALLGKVAVNLDVKNVADPIETCGIKYVISVPELLGALKVTLPEGVTLVDVRGTAAAAGSEAGQQWLGSAAHTAQHAPLDLYKFFPGLLCKLDDPAAILFSTGSTGKPKGIVLSHRNILAKALQAALHFGLGTIPGIASDPTLTPVKRLAGGLPFYHALGLVGTCWMINFLDLEVVYHRNPTEAASMGKVIHDDKCQVVITSPSLWSLYLGKNEIETFASLVMVLLGSEKCPVALSKQTKAKLGIYPFEAFGATEMAPLASSNTRRKVRGKGGRLVDGNRLGTVGQPIPGTAVKVADLDTGAIIRDRVRVDYYAQLDADTAKRAELDAQYHTNLTTCRHPLNEETLEAERLDIAAQLAELDSRNDENARLAEERSEERRKKSGVLWFKGPQIMLGYLNRPEDTAKVLVNGWYCTGDVGYVDEDGFVTITGRLSRFAKVAGEMVPLGNVELAIQEVTGLPNTAVYVGAIHVGPPRGEKLVVIIYHDPASGTPAPEGSKIVAGLKAKNLPALFIPKGRDFAITAEPFKLSEGAAKVDLKDMKRRADETFQAD